MGPFLNYYECHITLDVKYKDQVEVLARKHAFKTSVLKGDEFLGDDVKLYCTTHTKDEAQMWIRMNDLTFALNDAQIPYLRRKIEHIIYDERLKSNDKCNT